jgi:hypothetical protein
MRIVIFFLSVLIFCSSEIKAQSAFKSEFLLGGGMHTRGFQLTGLYSIIQNENKNLTFQLEFSELKSPKEKKINAERRAVGGSSSRSYIYGKQNNLYTLKLAAGQRFYISEKTDKSPVAIAFSYNGGLNLGMVKPYYLDLIYRFDPQGSKIISEKYSSSNSLKFLEPQDINGASGFSKGWDELTLNPGLYAKGSLIFDWGANDSFAKILELGLSSDIFFKNIPIVIGEVRPPLYLNLFMNFYFGKRW